MKIQLDTKSKTIRLDEAVNLGELQELLDKVLPGEWKSYKLEPAFIQWQNPIIIERHYPRRTYPWWGTEISTGTYSHTPKINEGIYCLQTTN